MQLFESGSKLRALQALRALCRRAWPRKSRRCRVNAAFRKRGVEAAETLTRQEGQPP